MPLASQARLEVPLAARARLVIARSGLGRGEPAQRAADHVSSAQGPPGAGPRRASLRGRGAGPAVGRRHHLRPERGGILVSGRRARCVQPPGGGVGDGRPSTYRGKVPLAARARLEVPLAARARLEVPLAARARLVLDALDMAVGQRRPASVIHHSDQGCQYTSFAFGERCRQWGVAPSMGSVGDCYDNAMAESFFATLECELLDRTRFQDLRPSTKGDLRVHRRMV